MNLGGTRVRGLVKAGHRGASSRMLPLNRTTQPSDSVESAAIKRYKAYACFVNEVAEYQRKPKTLPCVRHASKIHVERLFRFSAFLPFVTAAGTNYYWFADKDVCLVPFPVLPQHESRWRVGLDGSRNGARS